MPRQQGIQRVSWDYCDRCGFLYPVTMLVIQVGLKVCTTFCYDRPTIWERPMIIANALDDESELDENTDERLIQTDEDLRFIW